MSHKVSITELLRFFLLTFVIFFPSIQVFHLHGKVYFYVFCPFNAFADGINFPPFFFLIALVVLYGIC